MGLFNKKELEEIARLKKEIKKMQEENKRLENKISNSDYVYNSLKSSYDFLNNLYGNLTDIKSKIRDAETELMNKKDKIRNLDSSIKEKKDVINCLNTEMKDTEEGYKKLLEDSENIMYVVDSGTYDFHYHYEDSKKYEERLKEIKEEQREMVKYQLAVEHFTKWHINGSYKKGEIQMKNTDKLLLRAFNNE